MSVRVVRLGSPREAREGVRLGTVRLPPRGVRKEEYASLDWYDIWFPTLAPSVKTVKLARKAATALEWSRFRTIFLREMKEPAAKHAIALLATLSMTANFSVGCYCEEESRCHRAILRELLLQAGARLG